MIRWTITPTLMICVNPSAAELIAYIDSLPHGWGVAFVDCRRREEMAPGTLKLRELNKRVRASIINDAASVTPSRRFLNRTGLASTALSYPRTVGVIVEAHDVTWRAVTAAYVMLRKVRYTPDEAAGLLRNWQDRLPPEAEEYSTRAWVFPT